MAKPKLHAEEKQRQDRNRPSLCLLGLPEAGGEWSVIICEQERWGRVHESGLMLLWSACPMKEQSDFIKVWSQSDSYLSKSFCCCPFCHEGATLQAPQDISNFPMFQSRFSSRFHQRGHFLSKSNLQRNAQRTRSLHTGPTPASNCWNLGEVT